MSRIPMLSFKTLHRYADAFSNAREPSEKTFMDDAVRITVEGIDYDASGVLILKRLLAEQLSYRRQDAVDALKLFNASEWQPLAVDGKTLHRLARLAGATILEGV